VIRKRPRRAGMLAPVPSLRRKGDLGIGDVGALRELVDWAAEYGVGFLQLLPINETGGDHSPYNAISSVALEPSLIDLQAVEELEESDLEAARLVMPGQVLSGELVDYAAVKLVKRGLLETAFGRFWEAAHEGERWEEFVRFQEEERGWLEDYRAFRWLMDREGGSEEWSLWSMNYNRPERAREWIARERGKTNKNVARELVFFAWVQWVAFSQWRAVRAYAEEQDVLLMGDVPIGIAYCSADVFFEPQWFDLEWSGGAPPERVFKDDEFAVKWGQNWGIPLYRWDVLKADGFRWWRRRIEKLVDVFGIFRIDHILGFYRIYSFPWRPRRNAEFLALDHEEAARRTGGKLPGFKPHPDDSAEHRAANLAAGDCYLRAVQEAAGEKEVVGEDLGAVPDYVRPHLHRIGIAGFKILHWEVEQDKKGEEHPIPGKNYEECSFATYATHDHPSMAAMWDEFRANLDHHDYGARQGAAWNLRILSEIGGLTVPKEGTKYAAYDTTVKWALMGGLLGCNSRYAAFMITDLYGMKERFNVPGTVGGANWRVRMPFTVAEMRTEAELRGEAEVLAKLIGKTGR
jgi:4-alpha-glucanotransferase